MKLLNMLFVFLFSATFLLTPLSDVLSDDSLEQAQAVSKAFSQVAEKLSPSVVNISAVKNYNIRRRSLGNMQFNGRSIPLEEFFGDELLNQLFPDGQFGRQGEKSFKQQSGMGTGFIFDEDGYILTNNHVIEDSDELEIKLYDGHTYQAEIVGRDDGTDLAVLKIKADQKLIPVTLGDSDKLKIGELVMAVGNPFGLDHTVTTGVVSAKGRSIAPGSMMYEDYIQTDAAINPGNSGGPLVDLSGNVIGINSAIFSRNGGYMGIGFAIPVNLAKTVIDSLKNNGRVVRGWLGVAIQNITEDLASSFNYEGTSGALIGDVTADGPAAKGGLKPEDIIVKYNNKSVSDVNNLRLMVATTKPNTTVPVEVFRNGQLNTFEVTVGELANPTQTFEELQPQKSVDQLGLVVKDITPQIQQQLNFKTNGKVVVTDVSPYSVAANSGLRPLDVILKVADKDINNSQEFLEEIKKYDLSQGIRLVVETGGMKRFVVLKK